jgi:hypothetical protein
MKSSRNPCMQKATSCERELSESFSECDALDSVIQANLCLR